MMAKILVVEDETLLREEVCEWLMLEGYDAIGAEDGLSGLKLAQQHQPDLIISDVRMPNLDGFSMLLELNSNPVTAGIPFIFVSARAAQEDIRLGMNLGADDYLTKPFARRDLLTTIETRLQKKATQMQEYEEKIELWQEAFEKEHSQRLVKAKMVGMFSHDFRNPLAAILSSVGLLRNYENKLPPERKITHFDKIENSVKRLIQMLDDMLLIAQMESDSLEFDPEPTDITTFIREIVDEFAYIHVDSHKLNFVSRLEGDFIVDPKLLRQVVSNLISNAIKYSPSGGEIKVILEEHNGAISLSICDNGIGIPEQDIPNLFEPFHRASNVDKTQGTGLGLAIVKQSLDLHNGKLSIESKEGKGSNFQVCIPMIKY